MTAAERRRRYRRHLARGDQFFRGDLSYETLAEMIDDGLIEPDCARDPTCVGCVLLRLRKHWLKDRTTPLSVTSA
jgi:hypothetical protein